MLLFGGGIQSNTLAEIPNNIKNMLDKNYKKIATGQGNNRSIQFRKGDTYTINTNCNFTIKRVFVTLAFAMNNNEEDFQNSLYTNYIALDNLKTGDESYKTISFAGRYLVLKVRINGNKINLYMKDCYTIDWILCKVLDWVAIG